ncbi:WD40 repeat domain-containing protein [Nannocystis punicea]|uniref:WD40 repeat domain-containing protein n=1 Tax=Nannocystis punicea TaxID=2995304 RepID=A0ABY7HE10_9BACT|nr:WD40 repeat domain-containing protein [Nannocystis poenicansa]WAS97513.1 WD40 repeat domain-containing protein [Nannocystis poenicansa]
MADALPDLMDPGVLERAAADGDLDRLVAGWAGRLAAADDSAPRRAVLAALRVDLALIVREPELLFQCVYNRVYWHASAEAAAFYGEGTDEGAPLRAWVERWRAARGRRGPWARSLRPPEFPLLGPLREEYRGARPGEGAPVFSADAQVVGGAGASAIAWERATGRELSPELARQRLGDPGPEVEVRFEVQAWGRARVYDRQSGALLVDRDVDSDSKFDCAMRLADGTAVVVAGWCDDYDGSIARIDLPGAKVRWRVRIGGSIHALASDRAGTLVAASDGAAIHLLDGTSGATLASAPLAAHSLALSPDGSTLVTRHEDVLRVWDVAALRRGRPLRIGGAHEGWIDAAFSPDGRRLITGELLCDGRDGRLIARLDLDGPGYLEGGPPVEGRRLADDRFVEMAPGRGVVVWNSHDGTQRSVDRSRRYGHTHTIVVSPDGRWYVSGRRQAKPTEMRLCAVDDGSVRAELGSIAPDGVAFAPDSLRLLVASGDEVIVWSVPTGTRAATLRHPAAVTGVGVACDGRCAVTGASDGVLRVWELESGELRGSRLLTADDPVLRSYSSGGEETRVWRATPEALVRLEGWLGFSQTGHGSTLRRRDGLTDIVAGGRVRARVPAQVRLVAAPDGSRWASRVDHFVIADE